MGKGLIMIGYQGIGKSSCAGKEGCIDLESSNFFVDGKRSDEWYKPYCQIAMHLANQGYTVFTSSHLPVRETLRTMPRLENVGAVVIFCPRSMMKEDWIKRLAYRYGCTGLDKDYKALKNAEEAYHENIMDLMTCSFPVYQPNTMDYDLMDYVHKARHDWCTEATPWME